jgi:chorismate synthase
MKYHQSDFRNILERASARETAARVAGGAFFKKFLEVFNIYIYSQVISIGNVEAPPALITLENRQQMLEEIEQSPVRCCDRQASAAMVARIDSARQEG